MSQQLDDVLAGVAAHVAGVKNETAIAIQAELVDATPVDTRWASQNWIPSIGEPATEPGGLGAVAAGLAQVMMCEDPDADRYVANPVDYMPYLAEGSSPQAAAGWIDAAAERATAMIEQREASRTVKL